MDIPAALDRFVHRTRLDILTPHRERRIRNLRWLPLLALSGLVIGYLIMVGAARGMWSWQWGFTGSTILTLAITAGGLMRLFGPRFFWGSDRPLDERELMLSARAGHISGAIITTLTVLGCFYFAYAPMFRMWMPTGLIEWVFLGFGVQGFAITLPVLVASWLQPAPDEEE